MVCRRSVGSIGDTSRDHYYSWEYAMNQVRLGNRGERIAQQVLGGRRTRQRCPFDVIDRTGGHAYEVKCQRGEREVRVHMRDAAYQRKVDYAKKQKLDALLVLVVIHNTGQVMLYWSELKQHARPSNMRRIA